MPSKKKLRRKLHNVRWALSVRDGELDKSFERVAELEDELADTVDQSAKLDQVVRERDDANRIVSQARTALEELQRALHPKVYGRVAFPNIPNFTFSGGPLGAEGVQLTKPFGKVETPAQVVNSPRYWMHIEGGKSATDLLEDLKRRDMQTAFPASLGR